MDIVAPNYKLQPSRSILRAFGGGVVRPIGVCQLNCKLSNNKKENIDIEVVDIDTVPLLGLTACVAFGLVDIARVNKQTVRRNFYKCDGERNRSEIC